MSKKRRIVSIVVFAVIFVALLVGIVLTSGASPASEEPIGEVMKDAVLHETGKINLLGIRINPGLVSAFSVSGIMILFALIIRIFVIPKFKLKPGKFQFLLEKAVGLFDGLAKENSPHKSHFIGGYIFSAGAYIFFSTLFELFGFQAVTVSLSRE